MTWSCPEGAADSQASSARIPGRLTRWTWPVRELGRFCGGSWGGPLLLGPEIKLGCDWNSQKGQVRCRSDDNEVGNYNEIHPGLWSVRPCFKHRVYVNRLLLSSALGDGRLACLHFHCLYSPSSHQVASGGSRPWVRVLDLRAASPWITRGGQRCGLCSQVHTFICLYTWSELSFTFAWH